jgi:hypothetical protein
MANTAEFTAIGELRGLCSPAVVVEYMKHPVTWDREKWLIRKPLVYKGRGKRDIKTKTELTKLQDHREFIEYQPNPIRREDVFSVFQQARGKSQTLTEAFLLSMIWGFGQSPYGPYRTSVMLESGGKNFENMLGEVVELLNRNNRDDDAVKEAYRKLLKIEQCGPAFATKFMYFASPETGRIPIFDKRVVAWLTTADRDNATSHNKKLSAARDDHFAAFYKFCVNAAREINAADVGLVEYLMFIDQTAATLRTKVNDLPEWILQVRFRDQL